MNSRIKFSLYVSVLFSLAVGMVFPPVNILYCSLVATFIIARQRLELLPLLMLCNIPVSSLFLGSGPQYGSFEYAESVYEIDYISVAGLPVSAGLITVLVAAAVCYSNFMIAPHRYYPGALKILFVVWNLGAIFAVLIALNGILHHHQAWSGPLRAYLSTVGLFYGYSLAINSPTPRLALVRDFLIIFLCIGLLAILGLFHHRILFLGACFVPGLSFIALRQKELLIKLLAGFNILIWVFYSLLGYSLRGETTFTLICLFVVGVGLGLVSLLRLQGLTPKFGRALGYSTIVAIFLYMIVAIYGAKKVSLSDLAYSNSEMNLIEEIQFKVFDDRAVLWGFVLDDIMRDNKILPVPGEDLMTIHPKRGVMYVRHGAHNTYLQALRENGFISGFVIIVLISFALVRSVEAYSASTIGLTRAVAASSIATLTVGAVTGHYVIGQTIGVFIFMLAGMVMVGNSGMRYSKVKRWRQRSRLSNKIGS